MPAVPSDPALFCVLEATTGGGSYLVEGNDGFTLSHDGQTAGGVESLVTIWIRLQSDLIPGEATLPTSAAAERNKIKLTPGRNVYVKGGPHVFFYRSATGAATFTVARSR